MPDIVVHNAMGDKVLERLDTEISSFIDTGCFRSFGYGSGSIHLLSVLRSTFPARRK